MRKVFWSALIGCFLVAAAGSVQAAIPALERIKATQTVVIAFPKNAFPIAFAEEGGEPTGYSVELCRRVVAEIQKKLGLGDLRIKWVEGNTPARLAAIANGMADIDCGTTTATLDRQEQVDFSNLVFVESGGVLVRSDSGIKGLADLAQKRVGVTPSTTTEKRLRRELERGLVSADLVPVKDAKDGFALMAKGELDALAGDRLVLIGQLAESGETGRFAMLPDEYSTDPYAFALPRGDTDFRLAVNRALAQLYRTGEVREIFQRWFGDQTKPGPLMEAVFFLFGFED